MHMDDVEDSDSEDEVDITVHSGGRGLGLHLDGSNIVTDIEPSGASAGFLFDGDRIVAVNGKRLTRERSVTEVITSARSHTFTVRCVYASEAQNTLQKRHGFLTRIDELYHGFCRLLVSSSTPLATSTSMSYTLVSRGAMCSSRCLV